MFPELRATTLLPFFGFFVGFLGDRGDKFLHDGAMWGGGGFFLFTSTTKPCADVEQTTTGFVSLFFKGAHALHNPTDVAVSADFLLWLLPRPA